MRYRRATRLTLHFPGSGQGLPLCQSASVCPFPRPLLVDISQADPEATVHHRPRGVLIVIYQLSNRNLNARKHTRTIIEQQNRYFADQLRLNGGDPALFHLKYQVRK